MLRLSPILDGDRDQLPAPDLALDQRTDVLLAPGGEVSDGIEADDPLRAQGAREQIVGDLLFGCRARPPFPAEMALDQLIGLQHAGTLADRERTHEEGELERALRRLAARP